MEAKRYRREGPSLEALRAQVEAEYGSRGRIVAAEKVTVGGIRGVFSRQHFEVTVEVEPEAPAPEPETRRGRRAARLDVQARLGIAALLADADEQEARIAGNTVDSPLSTGSGDFAALMDDLTFNTGHDAAPVPAAGPVRKAPAPQAPAPLPRRGAGDLVVVIGLAGDAVAVARSMAAAAPRGGPESVELAGALAPGGQQWDRRRVLGARARAVEQGRAVFVAYGLETPTDTAAVAAQAQAILRLQADQAWVVVDAGRKPADTARWVNGVATFVPLDAVAVVGSDATSSPHTVRELALPVGWSDDAPTRRTGADRADRLG